MAGLTPSFNPFVDTRIDKKLPSFSGEDKDWGIWTLKFEFHTALLGWEIAMETAAQQEDALDNGDSGESHAAASRALYHLLANTCEGRALGLIRQAGKG